MSRKVVSVGSVLSWWFRNRETGAITVAQAPNPPLLIAAAFWLVARLADDGTLHTLGSGGFTVALAWWAGDEIVRGVNPWRRLLGSAVIAWLVVGLVG